MGKPVATFLIKLTLRAPDDMPPEVADALPTIGVAGTEEAVGSFIPTTDLLGGVLKEVAEQATQLTAGVSVERTDK